ncbi:hypothetical protein [Brachybacterium sp. UNK5269]|uniref:hypothetical protein n=1 Tax=Brachybacterium sp. UNK5269 TaxID=3408576 RepID=UPI003BB048DE
MDPHAARLDIGGRTLHASHTDEELVTVLSQLSWAHSPLLGLEGGDLGRLAEDIRTGTLTLPGRSHYTSESIVLEAMRRSAALHEELLQQDRKLWWQRHSGKLAVGTVMTAFLILFALFHDALLPLIPAADPEDGKQAAAGLDEWMIGIYHALGTYFVPLFVLLFLIGLALLAVARVVHPGPR